MRYIRNRFSCSNRVVDEARDPAVPDSEMHLEYLGVFTPDVLRIHWRNVTAEQFIRKLLFYLAPDCLHERLPYMACQRLVDTRASSSRALSLRPNDSCAVKHQIRAKSW